ncbi:hypothetical protein LWI29_035741 [Acer saccharum]|uniref:Plant UBX domain-containing protein 4 n=1 Tax=Acer saccharum TaxID=4024 RepID=A0AA39RU25_ACESA|nr:hypothetical protein LWI29_035741 [Acer saccharum]
MKPLPNRTRTATSMKLDPHVGSAKRNNTDQVFKTTGFAFFYPESLRITNELTFFPMKLNVHLKFGLLSIFIHLQAAQEALLEPVGYCAPQQPEPVIHNIVFWSNGFTVNDGPLRRLDDPENASFLESIRKSECPKELEPADRRSSVHVNLIRRDEKCPEPEKVHVPFQGVGRTLGSSSTSAAPETTNDAPLNTAPLPSEGPVVDENLPSTSIQIRLSDGTRMIAHFSLHHTINDVHGFIDASRPGAARNYQLQMMGFPPKLLTADGAQTIEQAGLANLVIIQKF